MLATKRLLLRPWKDADLAPFAAMNADPEVRRYFPGLLTKEESDASVRRFMRHHATHGHTFFAAELLATGEFVGFVGLVVPETNLPFSKGCLEIGWRLARAYWGRGLATEAARSCVTYALRDLSAPAVGAITTVTNAPSINVMRKLDMELVEKFLHPAIDPEDPIAPHVLYERSA